MSNFKKKCKHKNTYVTHIGCDPYQTYAGEICRDCGALLRDFEEEKQKKLLDRGAKIG